MTIYNFKIMYNEVFWIELQHLINPRANIRITLKKCMKLMQPPQFHTIVHEYVFTHLKSFLKINGFLYLLELLIEYT